MTATLPELEPTYVTGDPTQVTLTFAATPAQKRRDRITYLRFAAISLLLGVLAGTVDRLFGGGWLEVYVASGLTVGATLLGAAVVVFATDRPALRRYQPTDITLTEDGAR